MILHSIRHGFQAGVQAFKLLLGNSHTRTIFLVGLVILSVLFALPLIKIIDTFFSPTINVSLSALLVSIPVLILSAILGIFLWLYWNIVIVTSVLHPELPYGQLFSKSASAIFSGIGYGIIKTIVTMLITPLYALSFGILLPVINFFTGYISSFYFVQVIDEHTVFINTDKYKRTVSHNVADYFGLWLYSILFMMIVGLVVVVLVGICALILLAGYKLSVPQLIANPFFIFKVIVGSLFIWLSAMMVELIGTCLLYKDEEREQIEEERNANTSQRQF